MNLTHIYTKLGTMVTAQKEMQFMKDKSHVTLLKVRGRWTWSHVSGQ